MSRIGVPANFKGKKGRSGRKSALVEFDKVQTILKAWKMTDANLDKQASLAIVLKDMVEKKDSKITMDVNIITEDDIKLANQLNAIHSRTNIESEGSITSIVGGEIQDKE